MHWTVLLLFGVVYNIVVEASCPEEEPHHIFYHNNNVTAEPACPVARNCKEWLDAGITKSGIYPVDPDGQGPFQVYCDMETNGGGWTVFQRRQDGSVNFCRGWIDYEMGFGELDNEFWLGLGKIHRLTKIDSSLRVDFNQNTRYAHYDTFSVGDVSTEYVLTVGGYSGTAGDSLGGVSGMKFSTKDNDNDASSSHCAQDYQGAWWFATCQGGSHHWNGPYYSLIFTEISMKFRDSYPPSLYEQHCCSSYNLNRNIKITYNGRDKFIICPDTLPLSCSRASCSDILTQDPDAVSGYYNITLNNGSIASVYCDMEGDNCDGEGGWMRVANIDMTLPGATCPDELTLYSLGGRSTCSISGRSYACSDGIIFPSYQVNYTEVCGQVRGYRHGARGFHGTIHNGQNIDNGYVDGVSITYDSPRKHIWTYAGGESESGTDYYDDCPCNSGITNYSPSFVDDNYYCESATGYDDILWDGQQCNGLESPCCTAPNMPWFVTTLSDNTTSDIEVRSCTVHTGVSPVDIIELYIK